MTFESAINHYRPLLFSIAYEMTGDRMDAEDILQENIVKWLKVDFQKIQNIKAYLVKSLTNSCINYLKTLKRRKEILNNSFNEWINEIPSIELDLKKLDFEKEISDAVALLVEKLNAVERTVFVLREVFNFDYQEITKICNKKKEHCRQIFHRAKGRLQQSQKSPKKPASTQHPLKEEILETFKTGNINRLLDTLKKDL
jgi:RNA polymerase sigma factor (sigma-70 family)